MQARVDDFQAGLPQSPGQNEHSPIMTIQPSFAEQNPDPSHVFPQYLRAPAGGEPRCPQMPFVMHPSIVTAVPEMYEALFEARNAIR